MFHMHKFDQALELDLIVDRSHVAGVVTVERRLRNLRLAAAANLDVMLLQCRCGQVQGKSPLARKINALARPLTTAPALGSRTRPR